MNIDVDVDTNIDMNTNINGANLSGKHKGHGSCIGTAVGAMIKPLYRAPCPC